jgi:hypothetical protein
MKRSLIRLAVSLAMLLGRTSLAQTDTNTLAPSTPPVAQTGTDTLAPNNTSALTDTGEETAKKKAENPVSEIIRLQLMNYVNPDMGADRVTQFAQHDVFTYPIPLGEWDLITRTDIPFINQPSEARGAENAFGIGDITPQIFLVPRKHGKLQLGPGVAFTFPTASAKVIGSGSMSAGPAAVAVFNSGPWMIGTRISNEWSVAGWNNKGYNELWIQPFVYYNFRRWYLVSLPTYTANWKASSGNAWTTPAGGGFGKHWKVGGGGFDAQVMAFSNVAHPAGTSAWQLFVHLMITHPRGEVH